MAQQSKPRQNSQSQRKKRIRQRLINEQLAHNPPSPEIAAGYRYFLTPDGQKAKKLYEKHGPSIFDHRFAKRTVARLFPGMHLSKRKIVFLIKQYSILQDELDRQVNVELQRGAPQPGITTAAPAPHAERQAGPMGPAADSYPPPAAQSYIENLFHRIADFPEAQAPRVHPLNNAAVDNRHFVNESKTLSQMVQNHADSVQLHPVGVVDPKTMPQDDRKVFHVTPTAEGPIFMPRVDKDGNNIMGADNKPVYDMVYYVKQGNGFVIDPKKSFIAQDGEPAGSLTSVPKADREACWGKHKEQLQTLCEAGLKDHIAKPASPKQDLEPEVKAQAARLAAREQARRMMGGLDEAGKGTHVAQLHSGRAAGERSFSR